MVDPDHTQGWEKRLGLRRLRSLAMAMVMAVAVSAVLVLQTNPEPPPIEVAEAFMDAWEAGDGLALATMFSLNGVFDDGAIEPDQLPRLHDWYRVLGWTFRSQGCLQRPPTDNREVHCFHHSDHDLNRAFSRAFGKWAGVPFANTFVLVVEDGEVESFRYFSFDRFGAGWQAFIDWVSSEYPTDFALMYDSQRSYPILDEVSLELWGHYVEEFDPVESRS